MGGIDDKAIHFLDMALSSCRAAAPWGGSSRSMGDSMSHFRTAAFGIEVMQRMIVLKEGSGDIYASEWMAAVPEPYREMVVVVGLRAFEPMRGTMIDELRRKEVLARFVRQLHLGIWATVVPVPMDVDWAEAGRLLTVVSELSTSEAPKMSRERAEQLLLAEKTRLLSGWFVGSRQAAALAEAISVVLGSSEAGPGGWR